MTGYIIGGLVAALVVVIGGGSLYIKIKEKQTEAEINRAREEYRERLKKNAERDKETKENEAAAVSGDLEHNNNFIANRLQELAGRKHN